MSRYSFSQIQSYTQCPLKYRLEKIDKIKPDIPSESLHLVLGSAVHGALEFLYKKVSDMQKPTQEEVLAEYENLWTQELEDINQSHDREFFMEDDLEAFHYRGTEYIKYYFEEYAPFDQAIAMKTEENVFFELAEDINFSGKIDRLDIDGETLIINDYKTSKSLPKDDKDSIKEQIILYGIGVQKDYGSKIKKMVGRVIYLHLKREFEWEITEDLIESIRNKYLTIAKKIEQKKTQYQEWDEDAFPAEQNPFCGGCIFKQLCPHFKHQYMQDEEVQIWELWTDTIKHLVDHYKTINDKYKSIENERKYIAETLVEFAHEKWCKKLFGHENKVSITEKETYSPKKETMLQLVEKLKDVWVLEDMQNVDYHKLTKAFKNNELSFSEFEDMVSHKISRYITRTSKLKEWDIKQEE